MRADRGWGRTEVLIAIAIVGILVTVVVGVYSVKADAENSACRADRRVLVMASEAFLASGEVTAIPDAGGSDGFEQTLVDRKLIIRSSEYYDLDAHGVLSLERGSPCTV